MLTGGHAGRRENVFTLMSTDTHTGMHIHHTNTHRCHQEVFNDWSVIKEAQRSVKVKGHRSNQSGITN